MIEALEKLKYSTQKNQKWWKKRIKEKEVKTHFKPNFFTEGKRIAS